MTTCMLGNTLNNSRKNKNYKSCKNNIYNIIQNIKNASSYEYTYEELKNIVNILLEQLKKQTKEVEKLEDFIDDNNIYRNDNIIKSNNLNNYINNVKNNSNLIAHYEEQVKVLDDEIKELKTKLAQAERSASTTENLCCVCMTENTTHANRSCGHMCVCEVCSYHLEYKCPICRAEGEFIKIIKS